MTLKNAATFAFVGTLLMSALLIYDFVSGAVTGLQGLTPLAKSLPSFIYAVAALSLAMFFYVFRKTQT